MSLFVCFYCLIGWVGASRGLSRKVMDCRIGSSHEVSRRVTGFSFYHGLSDFFFFFTRNIAEGHELSNYRIFFTRSVAEGHGTFLFFTNYRIIEFSSHGMSWKVTGVLLFSDYRIVSSHEVSRMVTVFVTRLVLWTH